MPPKTEQPQAVAGEREAMRVPLSKSEWIRRYGWQTVLDAERMDVVPCVNCDDPICHGWRVQRRALEGK